MSCDFPTGFSYNAANASQQVGQGSRVVVVQGTNLSFSGEQAGAACTVFADRPIPVAESLESHGLYYFEVRNANHKGWLLGGGDNILIVSISPSRSQVMIVESGVLGEETSPTMIAVGLASTLEEALDDQEGDTGRLRFKAGVMPGDETLPGSIAYFSHGMVHKCDGEGDRCLKLSYGLQYGARDVIGCGKV